MNKHIAAAALLVAFGLSGTAALAGGPLDLAGSGGHTPVTYPNAGQSVTMNLDQGNLGNHTKAQADALLNQAFALWNNVPTASVSLSLGANLPVDVTAANYSIYLNHYGDGLNPVIYDSDGSITDSLFGVGSKNSILGFAGSAYSYASASYTEGEAVINGALGISDSTLVVVLAHELGHFIGLDHAQLDDTQSLARSNYVLMYPIAYRTLTSLHEDDAAAVSSLYPTGINTAYGTLTGMFTQTNGTAILGANIWAKEITTGKVYSCVSDYLKQGTGYYRMLLPPGTYSLSAESIQSNFTGGSSVGPYAGSSSSPSFVAPNPITPVAFQGNTPGKAKTFKITAGCAENIAFKLDGSGSIISSTCANTAPAAQNGIISTPSNTLANGTATATDQDNDPLTYFIVSQGTKGSVVMNTATGAFVYTPLANTTGADSFTFQVDDGTVHSNIATISVTITNTAPVISSLTATPQTVLDNATSQLQITAIDTDGPAALTYNWTILSGGGSLNNNAIANPIYTPPNVSASTTITLNVMVSDSVGSTSLNIPLTATDAAAPPTANQVSLVITADNANEVYLNGILLGTGSDWTKSRSYSAALQSGSNVLAIKGIDAGGVAAMLAELSWPGGNAVSDAAWKVSATAPTGWETTSFNDSAWPAATSYGQYGVGPWYKNVAGIASTSSAKWIWTANNDADNTVYLRYTFNAGSAPLVISTTSLASGTVGSAYSQSLAASSGVTPYAWSIVTGSLPAGLTLDATTGLISGSPTTAGSSNFGVQVRDNAGTTTSRSLSVTIAAAANVAPTITTLTATPQTLLDNATSQLQVVATDSDQGPAALSYNWSIVSGGGSLSSSTRANPIYTPANVSASTPVTISVAVSDGAAIVNSTLVLTVNDSALPPPTSLLNLIISTDNANEVYLNGTLLGTSNNWTQSRSYSAALQSGSNVLAVKGIDAGGVAALLAELSWPGGSAVSDASWKVSVTAPVGWTGAGFNDSAWPTATSYGQYGVGPWYNVAGIPSTSSAKWIWTSNNEADNTVYLRYTFTVQ